MSEKQPTKWRIVTDEPYDTCSGAVEFESDMVDQSMHVSISTKWDGCSNIWITQKHAGTEEETCYHHICDLDAFIQSLQDVREKARSYFNGEFCIATLDEEEVQQKIAEYRQQEVEYEQAASGLYVPKRVDAQCVASDE